MDDLRDELNLEKLNQKKKLLGIISLIVVIAVVITAVVVLLVATPEVEADEHTLTINVEGNGTTTPEPGTHTYEEGEVVTITAEPAEEIDFKQWTGDHAGTEKEITVVMEEDRSITAHFTPPITGPEEIEGVTAQELSYRITDCAELQAMKFDLSGDFTLENDINCEATEEINNGEGLEQIGIRDDEFTGTFDGQNNTIHNLYINRSEEYRVGLFGVIEEDAVVQNLDLENVKITGKEEVGALVGRNYGQIIQGSSTGEVKGERRIGGLIGHNHYGEISHSHSSAKITGMEEDQTLGGLIGYNRGNLTNSYAEGNVTGDNHNHVGGLVGRNTGKVIQSYATGNIHGGLDVGGLIGFTSGNISNTQATGTVEANGEAGGLVGRNRGKITTSYAVGTTEGEENVGGLAGHNSDRANITNSYATGQVIGESSAGGLVGRNIGLIANTYTTGTVVGDGWTIGGLIGRNNGGDASNSFSDIETTHQEEAFGVQDGDAENVEALSTWDMEQQSTYEDAGWDFQEIWRMNQYPELQWEE